MVDKQVRIDLTATDNASKVVEDVAGAVDDLEKVEPKVEITADGADAKTEIEDVKSAADKLATDTIRLTVETGMSGVLGDLANLRDELDKTSSKADDAGRHLDNVDHPSGGKGLRGQAIADLTGPLGDVSGAASDLAGVFDGISDVVEGVAKKVGVSAEGMATAVGGIGFAIIAATTLWSLFTGAQEKARRKQAELVKGQQELNDKISEGNFRDAAEQFEKLYGGALKAAEQLKVPTQAVVDFITGASDELPGVTDKLADLQKQVTDAGGNVTVNMKAAVDSTEALIGKVDGARDSYAKTNDILGRSRDKTDELADALSGVAGTSDDAAEAQKRLKDQADRTSAAFDSMKSALDFEGAVQGLNAELDTAMSNIQTGAGNTSDDIRNIKQDIIDVGETAKANPIEVATLLDRIDAGDYAGVKGFVEQMSKNNPAIIASKLAPPIQQSATGGPSPRSVNPGAPPPIISQTIYIPMGSQGPTVRRAGARFGNRMVQGARR